MRTAIRAVFSTAWLSAQLRRMAACREGASAVEFAIISPLLIALVLAILQVALIVFANQALETVAVQTSRQVMTLQSQGSTQANFHQAACNNIVVLFTCANLMVDVQTSNSFATLDTSTPTLTFDASGNVTNSWQFSAGSGGSIVVVRVMYLWPVFLGPLGLNLSNQPNNKRLLIATAAFKNEP